MILMNRVVCVFVGGMGRLKGLEGVLKEGGICIDELESMENISFVGRHPVAAGSSCEAMSEDH